MSNDDYYECSKEEYAVRPTAEVMKRVIFVLTVVCTTPLFASSDLSIIQCDGKECHESSINSTGDSTTRDYWCIYIDGEPIDRNGLSKLPVDDRLYIIAQLLAMEGDERISGDCGTEIHEFSSRTTFGKPHSVQVEALYLIHFVACVDSMSRYYAPVQELRDLVTGEQESISGRIVMRAFVIYQAWFDKVQHYVATYRMFDPRDCRPLMRSDEIAWVWP